MDAEHSQAIIMRIREIGESDLLVGALTPERGRIRGIAKGARRSRRRFANLDLFSLVTLEYEMKRGRDLHFLHSCRLLEAFTGLRRDFALLSLASYMVELTEALLPTGVADRAMFELLKWAFQRLSSGAHQGTLRIAFEARAMTLGGYGIRFDACCSCGRVYKGEGTALFSPEMGGIACSRCRSQSERMPALTAGSARALRRMQSGEWDPSSLPAIAPDGAAQIRRVLGLHMEYRLGRRLASAAYIE